MSCLNQTGKSECATEWNVSEVNMHLYPVFSVDYIAAVICNFYMLLTRHDTHIHPDQVSAICG